MYPSRFYIPYHLHGALIVCCEIHALLEHVDG